MKVNNSKKEVAMFEMIWQDKDRDWERHSTDSSRTKFLTEDDLMEQNYLYENNGVYINYEEEA